MHNSASNLESAIERIKQLECPTADVSNRVAAILAEYGVEGANDVEFERRSLDSDGSRFYRATIGDTGQIFTFQIITGADDYVAKVVDVQQG